MKKALASLAIVAALGLSGCGNKQSNYAQCVDGMNRIVNPTLCYSGPYHHYAYGGYYNNGVYYGGRGYALNEPLPKSVKPADQKVFKKAIKPGASTKPKSKVDTTKKSSSGKSSAPKSSGKSSSGRSGSHSSSHR